MGTVLKRAANIQVYESHADAKRAELLHWAALTPEERLAIGFELHAFWVRNFFPDASRLDRTVRIAERPSS
jgi:hypothetical protein